MKRIILSIFTFFLIMLTVKGDTNLKKENIFVPDTTASGYVIDSVSKRGIENAAIEIKNKNLGLGYYKTKTDKDGYYEIKDFFSDREYEIDINAEGYVSKIEDAFQNNKKYYLEKEIIIYGLVTDSKDNLLEGVDVQVKSDNLYGRNARVFTTTTDKSGNYQFKQLPEGEYSITFRKYGFITDTAITPNIKAGEKFRFAVPLSRPGTISGKLAISGVSPAVPARSIFVELTGSTKYSTYSLEDGSFQIQNVKPGKYQLNLKHRAFESTVLNSKTNEKTATINVDIIEGDTITDLQYAMIPREPSISVFTNNYTFPTGSKIEFSMKTFRLEKFTVKVYEIPFEKFIKPPANPAEADPVKNSYKLIKTWEEPVAEFSPYEWKNPELVFKDPIPVGTYCIEVEGADEFRDRKYFTVTSTGIVVKRSPDSILVYASDLVSNSVIAGAKVFFFKTNPGIKKPEKEKKEEQDFNLDEEGNENTDSSYFQSEKENKILSLFKSSKLSPFQLMSLQLAQAGDTGKTADALDLFIEEYGKVIQEGVTDKDGIFQAKINTSDILFVYVASPNGSFAVSGSGTSTRKEIEEEKYFVYTDRPTYRLGNEMQFKVLGKERKDNFVPTNRDKLYYKITNRHSREIYKEGSLKLDDWGSGSVAINIPDDGVLGENIITLYSSNSERDQIYLGNGSFYVEQYRKPDFKIDVSPLKKFYVNGENLEFKIEANYFFGGALAGAIVKYKVMETRVANNVSFKEDSYSQSYSSYGNKILKFEGEKALDENGVLILKIPAGTANYDRIVSLDLSITDTSNTIIEANTSVKVGKGGFRIGILPESNFFSMEDKKTIKITTKLFDDSPVSSEVNLKFYRYIWKTAQRLYYTEDKSVFETKVQTNEKGEATIVLNSEINFPGELYIEASSSDKSQNLITGSGIILIYDGKSKIASQYKNLELELNKTYFSGEEEVTLLVKSKFTNLPVLITLEGKDIYEKQVVFMTSNIVSTKIKVNSAFAPNFFITATMQRNRNLIAVSEQINVKHKDIHIEAKITANKDKYEPGEDVTVKIEALNENGKPVIGDFSLAVVDEAIYQIREDFTPEMKGFFYTTIPNLVTTNHSFPITLLAGAGKGGNSSEILLRKNFKDTAFWKPNIRTDREGKATLRFKLPDNLTTWRLTLLGHDRDGRLGDKRSTILCTKDLVARIGKPRFFIKNDKIKVLGLLNNNDSKGMESIHTTFEVENALKEPDVNTKISLPPRGSSRQYYSINVPENLNSLSLRYKARNETGIGDALEHTVPILSNTSPYKIFAGGDLGKNREITIPINNKKGESQFIPEEVEICLNPSITNKFISSLKFLAEYPYGCTEQNISKFLPAISFNEVWKKKTNSWKSFDPEIQEKIDKGIKTVVQNYRSDGYWGYWPGSYPDDYLTGYALYALYLVKKLGYGENIPNYGTMTRGGLRAIKDVLSNQKIDDNKRAYLHFVYTLYGGWDEASYKKLSESKNLNSYQLAFLIRSLHNLMENRENLVKNLPGDPKNWMQSIQQFTDRMKSIPILAERLKKMKKNDGYGVYFSDGNEYTWGWQGGRTELTAHVLHALLEAEDKSPLIGEILKSLYNRGRGGQWLSTRETANVLFSLVKYIDNYGISKSKKGNVKFSVNKKEFTMYLNEYSSDKTEYKEKVSLPPDFKEDKITIKAEGENAPDITFDVKIKGSLNFNSSKNNSTDSREKGFKLNRSYFTIQKVKDRKGKEYMVPETFTNTSPLEVGQEVLVKVQFIADGDYEHIFLEDFLPSGFEVTRATMFDNKAGSYTYKEIKDDGIGFYFPEAKKGETYEAVYMLRAELPGRFQIRASRIECMYDPTIGAWERPITIEVIDSKLK